MHPMTQGPTENIFTLNANVTPLVGAMATVDEALAGTESVVTSLGDAVAGMKR